MQTEIEAKFLKSDHTALRIKLEAIGAKCVQPMRLMRRNNYDFPDHRLQKERNGWARVRDEGDKITVSYKQLNHRTLHGTQEVCVTVDSFTNAQQLLEALGLQSSSYQETKRESWKLGDVEIELDQWPWTEPYVEIEAPDERSLHDTAEQLDLDYEQAVFGSVEVVYQNEYDVSDEEIWDVQIITFSEPVPKLFQERAKA
jgi:adenylate cyclase class 2